MYVRGLSGVYDANTNHLNGVCVILQDKLNYGSYLFECLDAFRLSTDEVLNRR